ncbi:MAG: outer membrane beta-barrel protein [Bacteroidota bacterium]
MKQKTMAFIATWLIIALTFSQAQTTGSNITGRVLAADGKPADGATILLLYAKDSKVAKTALSDSAGNFLFETVKNGEYLVWITLVGYDKYSSDTLRATGLPFNLEIVQLRADNGLVNNVTVLAKKPFVERMIDRTVVNVDALVSAAGATALEVLEKSPGVQVDQNGAVSLKGKQGVTIYIDDKPSYLSGDDLANYLRSLPASSIDQIELMTNPPAKYDAAGNGGIINIKTKKNLSRGFNGGLNLGANQGQLFRMNNSFNFNYRNKKFNAFGNLSHNLNNSFTNLDLFRMYKNVDNSTKSYFAQNNYFRRHGNTYNIKAGADYYVSDKTTVGMVLTGSYRKSNQKSDNTSNLLNAVKSVDSIIVARNTDDIDFKNFGISLNYRTQFNKNGHELTVDVDALTYQNLTKQLFYNYSYFPNMTLKSQDILTGRLPNEINIYSFKTDYTRPLSAGMKLSSGLKFSYAGTDNTADYNYTANSITRPDYDKSNEFIYKEHINAGYVNLNREGKKWSFQGGLRLEHTISNGHQLGNLQKPDSAFERRYASLFPTLYVSYKFDTLSKHQVGFNYGRRIDRPYYQDLNPFLYPWDKFTYYTGNPFLRPSFTHSLELSHTYNNKITTTLSYSRMKDQVDETIQILNGIYYSRPGNIGTKTIVSLSMDGDFDITKWLNIHGYTEFTNISSKSSFFNGQLNTSGSFWFMNLTSKFALGKGWDAELSGMYRTRLYNAQFILQQVGHANFALQKKLGSSVTLKCSINDIFLTRINKGTITNLVLAEANWVNKMDSRNFAFSFSYRFGKAIANQRRHDATGAQSEQNRVKN